MASRQVVTPIHSEEVKIIDIGLGSSAESFQPSKTVVRSNKSLSVLSVPVKFRGPGCCGSVCSSSTSKAPLFIAHTISQDVTGDIKSKILARFLDKRFKHKSKVMDFKSRNGLKPVRESEDELPEHESSRGYAGTIYGDIVFDQQQLSYGRAYNYIEEKYSEAKTTSSVSSNRTLSSLMGPPGHCIMHRLANAFHLLQQINSWDDLVSYILRDEEWTWGHRILHAWRCDIIDYFIGCCEDYYDEKTVQRFASALRHNNSL